MSAYVNIRFKWNVGRGMDIGYFNTEFIKGWKNAVLLWSETVEALKYPKKN